MDPLTFQRLHPRTYLERFLAEGIRPDGREPGSWRNVSINAGTYFYSRQARCIILDTDRTAISGSITTAEGSSLVRVGNTTVVCGIKAEITEPELLAPNDGFIGRQCTLQLVYFPADTHVNH
jgi:exosome complex component RRP43